MRLNGFIGIPTVTSLFYSKDSIIETLNKCWVTKELHALWSWIEINVFSLTLFTFAFYFSNILKWEDYIRDAKEPSYFVYNKSNVLYQMDLRSLHIDITNNLIMSTLGHMYVLNNGSKEPSYRYHSLQRWNEGRSDLKKILK